MHSTSNVTWPARTSATVRGRVMAGSGRRQPQWPPTAPSGSTARLTPRTSNNARPGPAAPEPPGLHPSPSLARDQRECARDIASSGWGEAPLGVGMGLGPIHRLREEVLGAGAL